MVTGVRYLDLDGEERGAGEMGAPAGEVYNDMASAEEVGIWGGR